MQRPVPHASLCGEVERLREPLQPWQRIIQHSRAVFAQRDVERFSWGERADEIRIAGVQAGVDDAGERKVCRQRGDERVQIFGDEPHPFRANLQLEMLDGDAFAGVGILAAKNGA